MATAPRTEAFGRSDDSARRPGVLCVGDGDLSYSVALARCFPGVDLVATTFPLEAELIATYATAARNLRLLSETTVPVQHGIDATALRSWFPAATFDHVIFNHPHLGLDGLREAEAHARRHRVLVAHFLASAAQVCKVGGHIHLGLCGRQPQNWRAEEAARRVGCLELVHVLPATSPNAIEVGALKGMQRCAQRTEWQSRKRFRHLHQMGPYGYEHRRTHGDADIGGSGNSVDLVWKKVASSSSAFVTAASTNVLTGAGYCPICNIDWSTAEALDAHVQTVTTPDRTFASVEDMEARRAANMVSANEDVSSSTATSADGCARTAVKRKRIECSHCSAVFDSRNKLFKHLKFDCEMVVDETSVDSVVGVSERIVLLLGYIGNDFHGSKFGGDANERDRPTVEGSIMAAAHKVWSARGCTLGRSSAVDYEAESSVSETAAVSSMGAAGAVSDLIVTVGAGCSTERFAHCASTLMTVNIKFRCDRAHYRVFLSQDQVNARLAAFYEALKLNGIQLIVPPKKFIRRSQPGTTLVANNKALGAAAESATATHRVEQRGNKRAKKVKLMLCPFDDMRRIVSRAVYKCAIPYVHLISPEDMELGRRAVAGGGTVSMATASAAAAGTKGSAREKKIMPEPFPSVWLSGFPPEFDDRPDVLISLLRSSVEGSEKVHIEVSVARCGGNATVTVSCPSLPRPQGQAVAQAWQQRCIRAIHHMRWPEAPYASFTLIALCAREARIKMSVHKRLKKVLKRLSGGLQRIVRVETEDANSSSGQRGEIEPAPESASSTAAAKPSKKKHSKNPARSFHNFTSDKKYAKSTAKAMRKSLMRCTSGLQDDVRSSHKMMQIHDHSNDDCDDDCGVSSSGNDTSSSSSSSWWRSEWLVVSFSAVNFLPEQVRRMVGVLVAVVRGVESMDYIDAAFGEQSVATPICPAGATWLDHIVLKQGPGAYRERMLSEAEDTWDEDMKTIQQRILSSIVNNAANSAGFDIMMQQAAFNAHVRRAWAWWRRMGNPRWWLAPMVGASEPAFRLLVRELGVDIASTEMVDSGGYAFSEDYRRQFHVEDPRDRPLIVQLGGGNPEHLRLAALAAVPNADAIELNIGCPQQCARKAKPQYGAFLMDKPDALVAIVKMLAETLRDTGVPLLCKIRCYISTDATVTLCKRLERAGCACLTVHGRTRYDKGGHGATCKALADWSKISAVKRALKIPVVGNGNVRSRADAEAMLRECGVDGVMSGVGLLNDPGLLRVTEAVARDGGNGDDNDSHNDGRRRIRLALRYLELCERWPPYHVCLSKHVVKILGQKLLLRLPEIHNALQQFARYTKKGGRTLSSVDEIVAGLRAEIEPDGKTR